MRQPITLERIHIAAKKPGTSSLVRLLDALTPEERLSLFPAQPPGATPLDLAVRYATSARAAESRLDLLLPYYQECPGATVAAVFPAVDKDYQSATERLIGFGLERSVSYDSLVAVLGKDLMKPAGAAAWSLLMAAGLNPDTPRPDSGETALMHAAATGCRESVARLIDSGADPDAQSDIGRTALHFAIRSSTEAAVALIEAGANPHLADRFGETVWNTLRTGHGRMGGVSDETRTSVMQAVRDRAAAVAEAGVSTRRRSARARL